MQPEKKWCAWCGAWGDHTSGECDDLQGGEVEAKLNDIRRDRDEWKASAVQYNKANEWLDKD